MYARARPFVDIATLVYLLNNTNSKKINKYLEEKSENILYFNSERAALKWYLSYLRYKRGKKRLKVAVQAFTCSVVIKAIVESGNIPLFLDINQTYFSTMYNDIEKITYEIDVLILTHLFGIPNPDYFKIQAWCHRRGVVILNDLAMTVGAKIGECYIDDVFENCIFSYNYDKPISTYMGGALKIKLDHEIIKRYNAIPIESYSEQMDDLCMLFIKYFFNSKDLYNPNYSYDTILRLLSSKYIVSFIIKNNELIIRLLQIKNIMNNSCFMKDISNLEKIIEKVKYVKKCNRDIIEVKRMGEMKIQYLHALQKSYYKYLRQRLETKEYMQIVMKKTFGDLYIPESNFLNCQCAWGLRVPVLLPNERAKNKIIQYLYKRGIETGTHNWGKLAFDGLTQFPQNISEYENSAMICRRIINVPIWDKEMWDNFAKK